MKSAPAIAFDYRPSRWLFATIVVVAALGLAAILFCGLNLWFKPALAVLAVVYAAIALRGFLRPPFIRITWYAAGHWRLRDALEQERAAQLLHSTVLGELIVLTLRVGPKQTVALVLLPDNSDAEIRRHLRVRLSRADAIDMD